MARELDDISGALLRLVEAEKHSTVSAWLDRPARSPAHTYTRTRAHTDEDIYSPALAATAADILHRSGVAQDARALTPNSLSLSSLSSGAGSARSHTRTHAHAHAHSHTHAHTDNGVDAFARSPVSATMRPTLRMNGSSPATSSHRSGPADVAPEDSEDEDEHALAHIYTHMRDDPRVRRALKALRRGRPSPGRRRRRASVERGEAVAADIGSRSEVTSSVSPSRARVRVSDVSGPHATAEVMSAVPFGTPAAGRRADGKAIEAAYRRMLATVRSPGAPDTTPAELAVPARHRNRTPSPNKSQLESGLRSPHRRTTRPPPALPRSPPASHNATTVGLLGELKRMGARMEELQAALLQERMHSDEEMRARVHAETMLAAMSLYRDRVIGRLQAEVATAGPASVPAADAWFHEALAAALRRHASDEAGVPRVRWSTSLSASHTHEPAPMAAANLAQYTGIEATSPRSHIYSYTDEGDLPARVLGTSASTFALQAESSVRHGHDAWQAGDTAPFAPASLRGESSAMPLFARQLSPAHSDKHETPRVIAALRAHPSPLDALRALRTQAAEPTDHHGDDGYPYNNTPDARSAAEPDHHFEWRRSVSPGVDFAEDERRALEASLEETLRVLERAAQRASEGSEMLASARSVYSSPGLEI